MKYLILSFFAGFAIMTVELIATRIIAPYIGMSIYTWTSVIGIILLGIAFGNYAGGRYADRNPSERKLGVIVLAAAFCVALIPELLLLIPGIAGLDAPLMIKNVGIAILLFFPSSAVLGAVYPFLAKLSITNVAELGTRAGLLSACATLGSILGTFATGFVFIGYVGSSKTLYGIAVLLLILSLFWKPFAPKSGAAIVGIGILAVAAVQPPFYNIIYSAESAYYSIKIADGTFNGVPSRLLFLDLDGHSINPLGENSYAGTYQEASPVLGAFAAVPIKSALVIGGGSYNIPKDIVRTYGADVTVAEIDRAVTETARMFFKLDDYPIKPVEADGRVFLRNAAQTYDLIFDDAFNSFISSPPHLATAESFREARLRMNNGGIYVINIISALEGGNSAWFRSIHKTFAAEFPNHSVLRFNPDKSAIQNVFLIGAESNRAFSENGIVSAINRLRAASKSLLAPHFEINPAADASGMVLTDDFSPVERLTAPMVTSYIKDYSRWFYETVGI